MIAVTRRWTRAEFAKVIAPRLRAIAEREQEPRIAGQALEAWGLLPEAWRRAGSASSRTAPIRSGSGQSSRRCVSSVDAAWCLPSSGKTPRAAGPPLRTGDCSGSPEPHLPGGNPPCAVRRRLAGPRATLDVKATARAGRKLLKTSISVRTNAADCRGAWRRPPLRPRWPPAQCRRRQALDARVEVDPVHVVVVGRRQHQLDAVNGHAPRSAGLSVSLHRTSHQQTAGVLRQGRSRQNLLARSPPRGAETANTCTDEFVRAYECL